MYIFNVFNDSVVKDVVVEYLKSKGVKYKAQKKPKDVSQTVPSAAVFQSPLRSLRQVGVSLKDGKVMVEIPEFLVEICTAIEQNIHIEGIFRKGGSASKQRDLKQLINSGLPLPDNCHVVDACNLVKLFLRELPEPLIPYSCHETLLSCLLLPTEKAQREALLLSCLLIHREHLQVLAYILEFLVKVTSYSATNKMDVKNLAIVLTPSLMPIDNKTKQRCNFNISHHIAVVELLIQCAADIGEVPEVVAEHAIARRGRKRRSASITRMFTGIRKIVGRGGSLPRETTPPAEPVAQKRKTPEILPPAVTVKRRREMADTTPRLCRMGGYSTASLPKSADIVQDNDSPRTPASNEQGLKRAASRKCGRKQGMKASKSTSTLLMSKKKLIERKLSNMTWGKRRSSLKTSASSDNLDKIETEQDEVVTIPRKEYEEMKSKVTCMEKMLHEQFATENPDKTKCDSEQLADQLNKDLHIRWSNEVKKEKSSPATAVQEAFDRTVENTEQLGPQLRKLRWSSEGRVARSPSERKIGSIRRRSRELARSNSAGAKPSLQRGRPNTRQTGLRTPRELSNPRKEEQEQWLPASAVLGSPALMTRLRGSPQKRDSITSLRKNNIGMVHAKAKFFDSLNHSTDGESDRSNQSMERRLRTVQLEMQKMHERERKEKRQPPIKAPLGVPAPLKTPRSVARPTPRSRATPLKALPDSVNTPLRGMRRSPRILSRTMSLHATASGRSP